ncbi:MAG: CapA family protein [Bacilli bacterium]|nr:CapA family protein [Bacilli bacterium]
MGRIKRRKRKLKRWVKISIILLIIILLLIIFMIFNHNNKSNSKINKKSISIDEIYNKINDKEIDIDFLKWYKNNYDIKDVDNYLKKKDYNKEMWYKLSGKSLIVLKDLQKDIYKNMDNVSIIDNKKDSFSFGFVGDVSLADNWYIMPEYDKRGKGVEGILDKEIVNIMNSSDVMVANNEFTVSDRGEKMKGKYYTFRGSPKRLSIYKEMGVDIVTLANNHVYDFGSLAFNDMLDAFRKEKIPYIGAGKNIEEASKPYYYIANGYKIGLVNATRAEKLILTPGASDNEEGVFRCYDPEKLISVIKDMKSKSDYVILLVHWGREDSHELEDVQIETSKQYIDAGADIIVGSHAHVLQGFEFYNNKFIAYNLGDFIFNHETKDTGILQAVIDKNGRFSYKFIPCKESDKYTKLLLDDDKNNVLDKMKSWSRGNITINSDGIITSGVN